MILFIQDEALISLLSEWGNHDIIKTGYFAFKMRGILGRDKKYAEKNTGLR